MLPEDYPQRDKILDLFRTHVRGLAACPSGEGFCISCWIVMILIWKLQPRLFMYIALPMLSIKGWIDGHTDRWHSWDGMPLPLKSMRKVK